MLTERHPVYTNSVMAVYVSTSSPPSGLCTNIRLPRPCGRLNSRRSLREAHSDEMEFTARRVYLNDAPANHTPSQVRFLAAFPVRLYVLITLPTFTEAEQSASVGTGQSGHQLVRVNVHGRGVLRSARSSCRTRSRLDPNFVWKDNS